MLSRVYALRPYVNIIKHPARQEGLVDFEVSILYMPYFRGENYVITDINHESVKDCAPGEGKIQVTCLLQPAGDLSINSPVISETYIIENVSLKEFKFIDTKFIFPVAKPGKMDVSFLKEQSVMKSAPMARMAARGFEDEFGSNHQNSNDLGGSGGHETP